jgi:hypothetical protein
LSSAYVLSIAFYIRLLAAFVLDADILACLVLAGIVAVGKLRCLFGLEKMELVAVTLKLSIIAGLFWPLASADVRDGDDISDLIVNDQPLWRAGMLHRKPDAPCQRIRPMPASIFYKCLPPLVWSDNTKMAGKNGYIFICFMDEVDCALQRGQ